MKSRKRLKLWKLLLNAKSETPRPLTCEECFALLTYFAELLLRGQRDTVIEARARQHLQHCPDCREAHERRLESLLTGCQQSDKPAS